MRAPCSVADMMTRRRSGRRIRLHVERERGAEIAVEMTLVEFVEQDRADAGKLRIVLDHARQNAFGDDFDARRADTRLSKRMR